jgi:hypothetical protein
LRILAAGLALIARLDLEFGVECAGSEEAISLRASSSPSLRPRSLTELLSGGGITDCTPIGVTLTVSCKTGTLSCTSDLRMSEWTRWYISSQGPVNSFRRVRTRGVINGTGWSRIIFEFPISR